MFFSSSDKHSIDQQKMRGKVCLITGASSGLGKETAKCLALMGARVIMTARDKARAQTAREELVKSTRNENIDLILADLSIRQEVNQLADTVLSRYDRLDVLINNAGGLFNPKRLTVDKVELTFAVNHLAYFLLSLRLLKLLQETAPSRIVNVSSFVHRGAKTDFFGSGDDKTYRPMDAYRQSKLANILFTYALARRLDKNKVTVNCLSPGAVRTHFGSEGPLWYRFLKHLVYPFYVSVEVGAKTQVHLATSDELTGVSGHYFTRGKAVSSSRTSQNEGLQEKLWALCEKMTAVKL